MEALNAPNFAAYVKDALSATDKRPVLAFPESPDSYNGFKTWTPAQLRVLINAAASHYYDHGTLEWTVTMFAIARMGHSTFVLSPRLTDDTVDALLKKARCQIIISERILPAHSTVEQIPMISSTSLYKNPRMETDLVCETSIIDAEKEICHTCHSSGSTGTPKLFAFTHEETMLSLRTNPVFFQPMISWLASALYNIVGFRMLTACLMRSSPVVYDNDRLPFTPDGLVSVMAEMQPKEIFVTPYSLGLIASKQEGMEWLKKAKRVVIFGAVCPQALGDKMVREGVVFSSVYGMSEVGSLMGSMPRFDDEWEWLSPHAGLSQHFEFRKIGRQDSSESCEEEEELYHMVVLPTHKLLPARFANCDDPPGSFATGDLFLKHTSKDNRWKLVGRMDDQVKIYQGDRQSIVNALVYEDKIMRGNEDLVDEVVLFGQGRSKLGVLVFVHKATDGFEDVVTERVWATVSREINGTLKTGIEKDMIVVVEAAPNAVPRTAKLNFIRPQVYLKYKALIDEVYEGNGQRMVNGESKGGHRPRK